MHNNIRHFNPKALYQAFEDTCRRDDISVTEQALQLGLHPSALTRLKRGEGCSVDTLFLLMKHIGTTDITPFRRSSPLDH